MPPDTDAGRMPALDGIRALAVLAVIAYHSGVPWMRGGYYGVDAFLVLSGFLITSLLVGEWDRTGGISITGFWARRARRLLPALFLMMAGVALVAGLWPAVLSAPHLLADSVATILYVANWHLAAEHASYFSAVNQASPLLHTWTLAIEEQFYVLWPLVVIGVLSVGRGVRRANSGRGGPAARSRQLRRLLIVAVAGALASAVWMTVLAPTDGSDPSRAYYGSDTRAQGLLVGAALALVCAMWGPVRTETGRRLTSAAGLAGAAGMAAMWTLVPETSGLAFHGGFLLITLACAGVVVAAARARRGVVASVLSAAPLRYLGRISYGMYLWYWPVLLVMTGARTHLHGYALLGPRLAVVVALAAASFHLVETPIRRGALAGWRGVVAAPAGALAAALAMLAATALPGVAAASPAGGAVPSPATLLVAASSRPGTAAPVAAGAAPGGPAAAEGTSGPAGTLGSSGGGTAGGGTSGGGTAGGGTAGSAGSARSRTSGTFTAPSGASSRGALAAAGPGGRPVRILLVGDSMAGSLGVGMADVAGAYGAEVVNDGTPGCSLSSDQQDRVLWYSLPPGSPCVPGQAASLLATWGEWVQATRPDVVVYLARTEVLDQEHAGQWGHVGQPTFDAWVLSRFRAAVPVLSAEGARVVLLTSPVYETGEQSSGDAWPEDDPARVAADNAIIRAVGAADPGVSVIDAGGLLSPGMVYRSSVDGVSLRCSDGVHLTRSGGRWLGEQLLPRLVSLGTAHSTLPIEAGRAPVPASAVPSWWAQLPCNT